MKSTKKHEKLLKLGSKRQSFRAVLAEKLIPAVAVGTALCIIAGIILHELLLSIYQENTLAHFHMLVNAANQNMNSMTYQMDRDIHANSYKNMLAFEFYLSSGYGSESAVYKLYRNDKEAVRTVRNGIALVKGKDDDVLCYADLSCYKVAYDRLSKYESSTGLFIVDTYILAADTIYADTEKGIFVPGQMHIEHYSYDRFTQPPTIETIEEFDLTPADTTGLTKYRYGQFTGGTVLGVEADDELFSILDDRDMEASKNGLISKSTDSAVFWNGKLRQGLNWFKSDLYAPDGTLYTVTALYQTDCSPVFTFIMVIICTVTLLICLLSSLIMSFRTYNVYKAHYAMEDYRRDMTNTLAHDLKTPLMAISGCAEMLSENADNEKQKHYSDMILSNVRYMDGMITNVLELSKLENSTELRKENINIGQTAREIVEKYKGLLSERGLNAKISGSGNISADKQLMAQVMDNLVSNAAKYASQGSDIEINIDDGGFTVKNSYDGSINKTAEELWQPFIKGDSARSGQNGSGLGLYIVRSICDRHGLTYSLNAENGIFAVTIGK